MELFESNIFDIIPNPFKVDEEIPNNENKAKVEIAASENQLDNNGKRRILAEEIKKNKYCNLHPRLTKLGINCLILNNSGNIGSELLLYCLIKAVLFALVSCSRKTHVKINNTNQRKDKK